MIKIKYLKNSVRTRIVLFMSISSLLATLTVGGVGILYSEKAVTNEAQQKLQYLTENEANKLDLALSKVEKNVEGLVLVGATLSHPSRMGDASYLKMLEQSIDNVVKLSAEKTPYSQASYVYFDVKRHSKLYAVWYVDEKNNRTFVKQSDLGSIKDYQYETDANSWYFQPFKLKKGVWSKPYIDDTTHVTMISYTAPIYSKGKFVGVAGIDMSFDNLLKMVRNIQVYETGFGILTSDTYKVLAGKGLKFDESLEKAASGQFASLANAARSKTTGIIRYTKDKEENLAAYSSLNNGFKLFISIKKDELLKNVIRLKLTLIAIATLTLILSAGCALWIGNMLSVPIEQLTRIALNFADNDFTVQIPSYKGNDELGNLNQSFKKFAASLRSLITQIAFSAENLSASAQQLNAATDCTSAGSTHISNSINELSQGVNDQTQSISSCLNSMNNINLAIRKIFDEMADTHKKSTLTEQNVYEGREEARSAVEKIEQIKATASKVYETINKLDSMSSQIGEITVLIRSIARQTDMLALNAAIEAARAGDTGKGFAVVADEVKKLATQSAKATDDITLMIKEIQNGTHDAVESIDQAIQEVGEGVTTIKRVDHLFESILYLSKDSAHSVQAVSSEIEKLSGDSDNALQRLEAISSVTEQTSASLNEINNVSKEQSECSQEINTSSQTLTKIAEELQGQVSNFKV